jgi:hypothetical protein
MLLAGEQVLDRRAKRGAFRIGPGDALGQRSARRLPLMDVAAEHPALPTKIVRNDAVELSCSRWPILDSVRPD